MSNICSYIIHESILCSVVFTELHVCAVDNACDIYSIFSPNTLIWDASCKMFSNRSKCQTDLTREIKNLYTNMHHIVFKVLRNLLKVDVFWYHVLQDYCNSVSHCHSTMIFQVLTHVTLTCMIHHRKLCV